MIDTHCHLNYIDKCGTIDELISEAKENSVEKIINIGADIESSQVSVELAEKYENIFATVGIHPHDAKTLNDKTLDQLNEMTSKKRVVAIGEIGLDYYRDLSPRDIQKRAFIKQLELAVEKKLPVVIHTRDSFDDTLDIIKDFAPLLNGGVFHCFPGDINQAFEVFELGLIISVGGIITFKNASMADVAKEVPLDRVIFETDAPYLTPVPYRGKTNRPAYVRYVYEHMAKIRPESLSEIEQTVDRTASKLFSLVEMFGG